MVKEDKDEQERIKRFITKNNDSKSLYREIQEGLRYVSGEQNNPNETTSLENGPQLKRNDIKKYRDWTVSHIRQNSYKLSVEAKEDTPQTKAIAESIQEDIDNAINSPEGREAIECAFNTMVSVGYGYVAYELDYIDKRSLDQHVTANPVKLPQNVYIGLDDSIDGSDAMESMVRRSMDRDRAEELVGKDKIKLDSYQDWQRSMYNSWKWNSRVVPDVTFSYIKEKTTTQHFDSNGEMIEAKQEGSYSRPIITRTVCVVRYIGGCRYESAEYPSEYLPIIAMRGDTNYRSDLGDCEYSYSGYYQLLKDLQEVLVYLLNEAVNLASKASKAPIIAVEGQLEGYEEDYESVNRSDLAVLYYKNITLNGTTAPPPQRMDNSAQVEWILSYSRDVYLTMQQVVGITPSMMGMVEGQRETAKATELRGSAGGLTISALLDNCEKSIQHGGKVVTDLSIHARPKRIIKFTPEDSEEEVEVEIDLADLGVSSNDFIYRPTQGPANESKRQAELNMLMSMGQYAPQDFANVQDLIVERMNSSADQEIVDRYKKLIEMRVPQLFNEDGQEDPEAVQALEAMSMQLQEAQAMMDQIIQDADQKQDIMAYQIQTLENEAIAKDKEIASKVVIEEMKQTGETQRNTQDNVVKLAEAQLEEGKEINLEIIKSDSALQQKELEMIKPAIEALSLQEEGIKIPLPEQIGEQPQTGQNLDLEIEVENEEGNLEATQ